MYMYIYIYIYYTYIYFFSVGFIFTIIHESLGRRGGRGAFL